MDQKQGNRLFIQQGAAVDESLLVPTRTKEPLVDEVEIAKVYGEGHIELDTTLRTTFLDHLE